MYRWRQARALPEIDCDAPARALVRVEGEGNGFSTATWALKASPFPDTGIFHQNEFMGILGRNLGEPGLPFDKKIRLEKPRAPQKPGRIQQ